MCITLREAELSNTKLYAGEARRGDTYVHVIAYQNKATTKGPNAMILPLPAAVMPGPENVVDTPGFKRFLDDIHRATEILDSRAMGPTWESPQAQVFDVGSYTVVLAASPRAVPEALARVPANKRPAVNALVLGAFEKLYPGWPLAVCCWDGSVETEPLLGCGRVRYTRSTLMHERSTTDPREARAARSAVGPRLPSAWRDSC
jgi:hypothetical protein